MLSSFALAAAAATPQPNNNAADATSATTNRVTTGITAPQLSNSAVVHIPDDAILDTCPNPARMMVRLNLDARGNTTGAEVLHSISPAVDAHVIAAVRQFHWRPASLDNQPIPLTVNLTVEVQH
ncbi:MAG TPA: energy transducer TonB [Acidobacteriaceae bacterium]|nr:energy transducer TonB [Acidobacteriaceae bacterium]